MRTVVSAGYLIRLVIAGSVGGQFIGFCCRVVEQCLSLLVGITGAHFLKGIPKYMVRAGVSVHWKIAFEHTSVSAKVINTKLIVTRSCIHQLVRGGGLGDACATQTH